MFAADTVYRAEARDVFSGDDLVLFIDLGIGDLYLRKRFRLHGVDTPNAVGQGTTTEAGRIRGLVYDLVKKRELRIKVITHTPNCLIGTVEVVRAEGPLNLNQFLIEKGYQFNRNKEKP